MTPRVARLGLADGHRYIAWARDLYDAVMTGAHTSRTALTHLEKTA